MLLGGLQSRRNFASEITPVVVPRQGLLNVCKRLGGIAPAERDRLNLFRAAVAAHTFDDGVLLRAVWGRRVIEEQIVAQRKRGAAAPCRLR